MPQQSAITEINGSKVEGDEIFIEEEVESEESLRGNVQINITTNNASMEQTRLAKTQPINASQGQI